MKTKDILGNLKKLVANRRKDVGLDEIIELIRRLLISYRLDSYTIGEPTYDKNGYRLAIIVISISKGSESTTCIYYDNLWEDVAKGLYADIYYGIDFSKWREDYKKKLNPKRRKRIKRKK